ncbi:uncharacterized protein LOC111083278 [Limulus polyphemus]|uniref:Condensin complex subunit 2 n=1 Tax=Limulus polyphemus TaxID=6850 RepID=A0ABM1RVH2_LIMPO|nr:uncharacterized protein LOC111083278 [Limulus polyphemus]
MPPGTADDSFPSPLLRRSFGRHFATPTGEERASSSCRSSEDVASQQSSSFGVPENDDEAERRQRHRDRVLELQRKNLNSPLTPTDRRRSLGGGIAGLTNAQLAEHYKNCIKLSSENKITVKNAFGLHLIDYMADVLKNRDGTTNFQDCCKHEITTRIHVAVTDYKDCCKHEITTRIHVVVLDYKDCCKHEITTRIHVAVPDYKDCCKHEITTRIHVVVLDYKDCCKHEITTRIHVAVPDYKDCCKHEITTRIHVAVPDYKDCVTP